MPEGINPERVPEEDDERLERELEQFEEAFEPKKRKGKHEKTKRSQHSDSDRVAEKPPAES